MESPQAGMESPQSMVRIISGWGVAAWRVHGITLLAEAFWGTSIRDAVVCWMPEFNGVSHAIAPLPLPHGHTLWSNPILPPPTLHGESTWLGRGQCGDNIYLWSDILHQSQNEINKALGNAALSLPFRRQVAN